MTTVPLYVQLNIDIDARMSRLSFPAVSDQRLANQLPISQFINSDFYRVNSSYQLFETLASINLSDAEKWDAVSYIWQSNTTPEALANGRELYAQNC